MAKAVRSMQAPALNAEQLAVVSHRNGPARVIATAGAGKTMALIERAAALVEAGVDASRILMITFSVAARKEMERRLRKRMPVHDPTMMCRTFHSIATDVFRAEEDPKHEWAIDTSLAMTRASFEATRPAVSFGMADAESAVEFAGIAKNRLLLAPPALRRLGVPEEEARKLKDCATTYCSETQSLLDVNVLLDWIYHADDVRRNHGISIGGVDRRFASFDDLLVHAAHLLQRADVRMRWQKRWDFVMQDEAQDQNQAQAEIARALCASHRNYMVVGDPAQSIYGFRGSDPNLLLSFDEDWPGAITLTLKRNYRCGKDIVDTSNRIIRSMPQSTVVPVQATSERSSDAFIVCNRWRDSQMEAAGIAQNIRAHQQDGVAWSDQAVLVRMRHQAAWIEAELGRAEIPYRLLSIDSAMDSECVRAMRASCRMFSRTETKSDLRDALAALRIGQSVSERLVEQFDEVVEPADDFIFGWTSSPEFNRLPLRTQSRVRAWVQDFRSASTNQDSPQVFVHRMLQALYSSNPGHSGHSVLPAESGFLSSLAASCDSVQDLSKALSLVQDCRSFRARDKVTICTMHHAKGMEWSTVYVPGCDSDILPSRRADPTEERRLFYVAITRARDELWLSFAMQRDPQDSRHALSPSRFIYEADIAVMPQPVFGRMTDPEHIVGQQLSLI